MKKIFTFAAIVLSSPDFILGSSIVKHTSHAALDTLPQVNKAARNKRVAFVDNNSVIPAGGGETESEGLSITALAFNLMKSCLGTGILSLPAGIAAMGDVEGALVPASIVMAILGSVSAYSFFIIGKLCEMEDASSFGEVWEKTIGKESSWIVTAVCFLTPLGVALSFSIVLGDFLSSLATTAGLKGFLATRHFAILAVTLVAVYPLTLLKSLAALAPMSIIGVLGVVVSAVFMYLRMKSGSYAEGGKYFDTIASTLQPSFGKKGLSILSPTSSILCSMAATAYLAHFLAPDFYRGLKNANTKRFATLSAVGFSATGIISIFMMCVAFLTFGGNSAGMILKNYSAVDPGAILVRLLMVISVVGSYPFIFGAVRASYLELTTKEGELVTDKTRTSVTRAILAGVTIGALLLEDAGFVVSFNGALMGSAIIYIFPSLMYLQSMKNRVANGLMADSTGVKLEAIFNKLILSLGVILAIMGGTVSVLSEFFPHLL